MKMHPLAHGFLATYNTANPFMARNTQFYQKGHYHIGVDYILPAGTLLMAPYDGEVFKVFTDTAKGNVAVFIFDGEDNRLWGIELCHLQELPKVGKVKQGDVIAISGNTGSSTTGPHVHVTMHLHAMVTSNYRKITGPEAVKKLVRDGRIGNFHEYAKKYLAPQYKK